MRLKEKLGLTLTAISMGLSCVYLWEVYLGILAVVGMAILVLVMLALLECLPSIDDIR